jgi:ATP-dependent RNA helicase DDX55/SPB4
VSELVRAGLRNPYQVNVAVNSEGATKQKTPSTLRIEFMVVPGDEKVAQLVAFLKEHKSEKVIVYALTCASVEWLGVLLAKLPGGDMMPTLTLHGNMRQTKVCCQLSAANLLSLLALLALDVRASVN